MHTGCLFVVDCRAHEWKPSDYADSRLMKRELAPIMAAKWDRIIPCHGDVIETGGRAAWDKVWAKFA